MRTSFMLLGQAQRIRRPLKIPHEVKCDLRTWLQMLRQQNGQEVRLGPRAALPVGLASMDASTDFGMGGFLDGKFFSASWESLKRATHISRDISPFVRGPNGVFKLKHINFLEIFTVFWYLKTFGRSIAHQTVVFREDKTAVAGMMEKLWSTMEFIPLLKKSTR